MGGLKKEMRRITHEIELIGGREAATQTDRKVPSIHSLQPLLPAQGFLVVLFFYVFLYAGSMNATCAPTHFSSSQLLKCIHAHSVFTEMDKKAYFMIFFLINKKEIEPACQGLSSGLPPVLIVSHC